MLIAMRRIAIGFRRLTPVRAARRFARHEKGATAVEFGMVALPFLALTFAILETALVFFADQTLEAAVSDSARLILTGQAQTASYSQADFKTQVCNRLYGMFDCTKLTVYVTLLGNHLDNLGNGNRLLVATSVFRNEPYGGSGSCS